MRKLQTPKKELHKLNNNINFPELRIIGEFKGEIMPLETALAIAISEEKDLILINDKTTPPIAQIYDYGKFLYEQKKKDKERAKIQKHSEVKDIQLSVNITDHDLDIKARKAYEFLKDGNKVRCSLILKNREKARKESGELVMLKFVKLLDNGELEAMPTINNHKWSMMLKPKK